MPDQQKCLVNIPSVSKSYDTAILHHLAYLANTRQLALPLGPWLKKYVAKLWKTERSDPADSRLIHPILLNPRFIRGRVFPTKSDPIPTTKPSWTTRISTLRWPRVKTQIVPPIKTSQANHQNRLKWVVPYPKMV